MTVRGSVGSGQLPRMHQHHHRHNHQQQQQQQHEHRDSQTVETSPWQLDSELEFHISHCPCSCNHLGFGNYLDYHQIPNGSETDSPHPHTIRFQLPPNHHETSFNSPPPPPSQQQQPPPPNVPNKTHHHLHLPTNRRTTSTRPVPPTRQHHPRRQQEVPLQTRQTPYIIQQPQQTLQTQQSQQTQQSHHTQKSQQSHKIQQPRIPRVPRVPRLPRPPIPPPRVPSLYNLPSQQHTLPQPQHHPQKLHHQPSHLPHPTLQQLHLQAPFHQQQHSYDYDYQLTPLDSCSCDEELNSGDSSTSLESVPGGITGQVKGPWCICLVVCIVVATLAAGLGLPLALNPQMEANTPEERMHLVRRLLQDAPLIDGHNDLPWNIRKFLHNRIAHLNMSTISSDPPWARSPWSHTDIPRLRAGLLGAQFWSAYVPCHAQHRDAVQLALEQIDVIRRLVARNHQHLTLVRSAEEILQVHRHGRIASLIGVEGGHALGNSLAVLRTFYHLGARYLTLTHACDTPWAQNSKTTEPSTADTSLSLFGRSVVREMNRLGMIVDLSHTSTETAKAVLNITQAPVIFSHSSAYSLCNSSRNVPDDVLKLVAHNGGVVMVNFYTYLVSCSETASMQDVVRHINYIRAVAGVEHVGLGAGYDGINMTPTGLEDVSRYPHLLVELLADPAWSPQDISLLAGKNLLRVFTQVEIIRDKWKLAAVLPGEDHAPPTGQTACTSIYS